MIPTETIAIFLAASIALAFAPGPDNIFVLTQSALYGRKAGILVTLGLSTGLLVHTAAVSLGVAAVFQTSVLAFNILKIVGANGCSPNGQISAVTPKSTPAQAITSKNSSVVAQADRYVKLLSSSAVAACDCR